MDTPLSQSNVSLKLEEIQRRCSELLEAPDGLLELALEEEPTTAEHESHDPYNHC